MNANEPVLAMEAMQQAATSANEFLPQALQAANNTITDAGLEPDEEPELRAALVQAWASLTITGAITRLIELGTTMPTY
jgi:hypothetical protein